MNNLYSIGIGQLPTQTFLKYLNEYKIDFLVDVRSVPHSRYRPEFDKEALELVCSSAQIKYAYMGKELGGFPKTDEVLTHGHVDYEKLARQPDFMKGLERLARGAGQGHRIAILCSEGRPEECHRSKCIGIELDRLQVNVLHIDPDGLSVTQSEVMKRIDGGQISIDGLDMPRISRRNWESK